MIERLRGCLDQYITSNLDHHCLFVALKVEESRQGSVQRLDCYQVETSKAIREEKEFVQEIYIKMKEELVLFYLVSKGTSLSIIKEKYREGPKLELTDHNLEESATDISQNMLIIKNLSPRIISVKFLEQNVSKCTDPIQIIINDRDIYQFVLYRINRIKYQRLRAEDNDKKLWRSFD